MVQNTADSPEIRVLEGLTEIQAFDGRGQLELHHKDNAMVDLQFYTQSNRGQNNEVTVEPRETVDTNHKIGGQRFSSESVVGVQVGESEFIHLHPGWNQDLCQLENGSGRRDENPVSLAEIDPNGCSASSS